MARTTKSAPVKFNLRLPPDLRDRLTALAEADDRSLNWLCVRALENYAIWREKQAAQDQSRALHLAKSRERYHARATSIPQQVPTHQQPRIEEEESEPLPQQRSQPAGMTTIPKVGANQPCPCRSGLKYKHCHGKA